MHAPSLVLELPDHWTGAFEPTMNADGSCAGVAEIFLDGVPRCALVIADQPTWDIAFQRAQSKAVQFVRAWTCSAD